MRKTAKKPAALRRVRIEPVAKPINNKPPKNWDLGYELVVSFHYGLDEEQISKIAGLRNCDSGYDCADQRRDLIFPCGTDRLLAHMAGARLAAADHFGALTIKISYPVEHKGSDSFTPWHDVHGKLLELRKHRKLSGRKVIRITPGRALKSRRARRKPTEAKP